MNGSHSKVGIAHLLREPVHLLFGVAEDHSLCDGEGIVQIAKGVEFPLLALHGHEELLDAFQRQLVTLHQDAERIIHELVGHFQDLVRHGSGDQHHLCGRWQVPVDIVDLLLEAPVEHLIGFIQNQHLDVACAEMALLDHVEHPSRCAGHDLHAGFESVDVIGHTLATDADMNLHVEIVTQCQANLLALLRQLACWGEEQSLRLA
mmetsp:Transcript_111685/g.266428  ORF Transcript_111685/g.266428 Transcript_111685/m.266428 type:complete len:205 (+) Transcript_111685:410-1024(+)